MAASRWLVAVNRTEWLNLLGQGEIRMLRQRVVGTDEQPTQKNLDRVLALAPQTNIDSPIELFVLDVGEGWASIAARHPASPADVRVLRVSDVVAHRTVAQENLAYYSVVGERYGVVLDDCDFEPLWLDWAVREQIRSVAACTARLLGYFGNHEDFGGKRADRVSWQDLGRILLGHEVVTGPKPGHVEQLLRSGEEIVDRIAGTRDAQSFHLAAAIVWIETRTGRNPQRSRDTAARVREYLDLARSVEFAAPTADTAEALGVMAGAFPRAFTDELTPEIVSSLLEVIHDSASRSLAPDRVVELLRSAGGTPPSQSLLAFVITARVGVERIGHLHRALERTDGCALRWDDSEVAGISPDGS